MVSTARRIASFGTSIFSEMSALALEHQAINLSQGFPDFAGPAFVKQAVIAAIAADHNQYAPSPGLPALREAVAATYRDSYGLDCGAEHVTITSGATEALFATIQALIDPGDEVILFEPAYDSYGPDTIMAGGTPRFVRLYAPQERPDQPVAWAFDPDELRAAFTDRTRVLVLNSPHNPTGKVFNRDELATVAGLCQQHDVIVISDEVYDRMVFSGQHTPIATLPGMWERTVTINSTGKTFSMTGWKIGYAIAPPALTAAIRSVHQWTVFAVATPFQHAMAEALEHARTDYYPELERFYRERRDRLATILDRSGFGVVPPDGTYFIMADIRRWQPTSDVEFCRMLTTDIGVAAIPPSAFYADPPSAPLMARFCFAKALPTLEAAGQHLLRLNQPAS